MAEIRPFHGWKYSEEFSKDIHLLTAPLFDVVTTQQLDSLYKEKLNCIHLSVPQFGAEQAKDLLNKWKDSKFLVRDSLPAIYPYFQEFQLPGEEKTRVQKGFICHVKIEDWEKVDSTIRRHENTIPGSVGDRYTILEETGFQVSPTHGLYTDEEKSIDAILEESMEHPLYQNTSEQGIREKISVIHDYAAIKKIMACLGSKNIILADGHHRYEAALRYAKARGIGKNTFQPHECHLMWLTNTAASDITILPTHRLIHNLKNFDFENFKQKLREDFEILESPLNNSDFPDHYFILMSGEQKIHVKLKDGLWEQNPWPFPKSILQLDLTVLHYFILEKILGIPGKEQRSSPHLIFERDIVKCEMLATLKEVQLAIQTQPVNINTVLRVCESGYTLPQKSTYFYPKVTSGFVFSSLLPEENRIPDYAGF